MKNGLSYYKTDTDRYQDLKIKRLKRTFGCNGLSVYDYILNEVYRVQGCFLAWDENTAFDVAEYFGLKENLVNEIVKYCASVGLFDKELLCSGIITSRSIQERYLQACIQAKRKNYTIPSDVSLLNIPEEIEKTPEEIEKTPEESEKTPEVFDKEKKSIVKKTKEKESIYPPPQTPPPCGEVVSSSEGGGGGNFYKLYEGLCDMADVREDVYDAVAISNCFANELTGYYTQWLGLTAEQRRGYPLNDLNNAIRGRNPQAEYERWRALCWVRDNTLGSEWQNIYGLASTEKALFELRKLVKECKKGKIAMPGKFIIKHLTALRL